MSLKNFKISADGKIDVDEGTIKFTGAIVITREENRTEEEISLNALKIEDEGNVSEEGSVKESPAKSVNLLEENSEGHSDEDDVGADTDNDEVADLPAAFAKSKINFHDDSDVDEDYELSQTVDEFQGYGYNGY